MQSDVLTFARKTHQQELLTVPLILLQILLRGREGPPNGTRFRVEQMADPGHLIGVVSKSATPQAWENVQVEVENLLEGRLAASQEDGAADESAEAATMSQTTHPPCWSL
jgi:hypothetical protein